MTETPKSPKKATSQPEPKKPGASQPTNPEKDKTVHGDEELVV